MPAASTEALFAAALRAAPAAPLVTFHDRASGERTELSARSLANWVAKTYWLLRDEHPDEAVHVDVPLHWMWWVLVLGAWTAGAEVVSDPAAADVAFVADPAAAPDVPERYAVSLAAWGRPFDAPPPGGAADFVLAVRPQPDAWAGVLAPPGPARPALDGLSRADLAAAATARAAELGLAEGARLLVRDDRLDRPLAAAATLLAPLTVGGSVVAVRHAAGDLDALAAGERVTATA